MRDPRLRARALLAQSKYTEALRAFEEARQQYPESGEVLVGLGRTHLALGDVERAGQLYEMAVALEPNNPSLQVGLGIFHLKFNRYGEAETAFRTALGMDGIRCCSEKLSCCIQQGRAVADAAREYERALSLQPDDLNTRFNLGLVRNHLGQYEQAKMLLNEVVSENPRHARALYALGEALLNEGKEADARLFEQTLEVDTTYAQAHVQIARLDMRDNDLAAAAQRLRRTFSSNRA